MNILKLELCYCIKQKQSINEVNNTAESPSSHSQSGTKNKQKLNCIKPNVSSQLDLQLTCIG